MINGEHWLSGGKECNLTVVPMQGYRRDSVGYELPVPPSPNLRNAHAIALYPSLCLFEGTNCGVGRGTSTPFEIVTYGKDTMDLTSFTPLDSCMHLDFLMEIYRRVPKGKFFLKNNFFDRLAGTDMLRRQIAQGKTEEEIRASWQPALRGSLHLTISKPSAASTLSTPITGSRESERFYFFIMSKKMCNLAN